MYVRTTIYHVVVPCLGIGRASLTVLPIMDSSIFFSVFSIYLFGSGKESTSQRVNELGECNGMTKGIRIPQRFKVVYLSVIVLLFLNIPYSV